MINAAITPGTHPINVNMVVIMIDPHPLSITASGGKMIHNNTRQQLIKSLPHLKVEFFCLQLLLRIIEHKVAVNM
jgi:hypothetical protein